MQVFSPLKRERSCAWAARGFCFVRSMDSLLWQLRHSSESFAFMRSHSRSARCLRSARNLSRVSMEPKIRAHARAIGEVDCALELLEDVGLHLMAADAELLRVGRLQDGVEAGPGEDPGNEPAKGQGGEAERARRREGLADPVA